MADGSRWGTHTHRVVGKQKLTLGDCLAEMAAMTPGSIDVVVTSPPYNLNLAYGTYYDAKDQTDYIDWLLEVSRAVKLLLKPKGSFFLNISGSSSRPWVPFELMARIKGVFELQNHISWIKSIGIGTDSTGHYKPVSGRRFMHHNHEHIFHLTKSGNVELDRLAIGLPFKDKSNIARRGHERDLRCRGNTWFIPYSTVKSRAQKFNHPATFPVELPLWCIFLHGSRDIVVLDPFAGAGATLVAAELAGANGIGIDIDAMYVDTAEQRLRNLREGLMKVTLNEREAAALLRQDPSTRGQGGFQNLMLNLQDRLNKSTSELTLTKDDMGQIHRNAFNYGNGGWETRLKETFERHLGPNLDGIAG